jgi:DNA-binding transcriptional MerR regulator
VLVSQLDMEWVKLILEAKEMGLKIEEIQQFLREKSLNESV